jgi:hypothetical protein
MKTTDAVEGIHGSTEEEMKSQNASQRGKSAGRRNPPLRIPQIPMEWMDPMSWRLPSGKALAEFALQAGFLAPLMLSSPLGTRSFKKRKAAPEPLGAPGTGVKTGIEKQIGEEPEHSGSFRQTR